MVEAINAVMANEEFENLCRAFNGNESVWFHPQDALVAIWYGGATVNIYDANTFEEVSMFTESMAFEEHDKDELQESIDNRLEEDGFVQDIESDTQNNRKMITE